MTYPKISFKIKRRIKEILISMIVLMQLESCSKKPKNTEISNARVSIKKPKIKKKIPITFTVDSKKIKEKGDLNMTVDVLEGEGEIDLKNSTIRVKDNNKIEKTFYYTPSTSGNHKLSINANGLGVELNEDITLNVSDETIDTNFTIKTTKKKNYPGDKVQISIHTNEKKYERLVISAKSNNDQGRIIEDKKRKGLVSYYFIADKPGDYKVEIENYDEENLKNVRRKTIQIKISPFEFEIQNITLNNTFLNFEIKSNKKELEYILSEINIEDGEIEIFTQRNKKDQKGRLKLYEGKNKLEILLKTIPLENTKIQLTIEDQFGSTKKIEVDIKDLCELRRIEERVLNQNQNKTEIQNIINTEREIIKSLAKKKKKILKNRRLSNPEALLEEIEKEKKELISLQKKRKKLIQNRGTIESLNTDIDNDIINVTNELKNLEKKIITSPNGILESCIQKNDIERLQKILTDDEYDLNNNNGSNLLYSAYKNKNIEALKILLEQNIETHKDRENKTLLHLAAEEGETEILNILLNKTENKNPKDQNDNTPFDLAIQNKKQSVIRILAKWNKENLKKLIIKACKKGEIRKVKILLENSYQANEELKKKETVNKIFKKSNRTKR